MDSNEVTNFMSTMNFIMYSILVFVSGVYVAIFSVIIFCCIYKPSFSRNNTILNDANPETTNQA